MLGEGFRFQFWVAGKGLAGAFGFFEAASHGNLGKQRPSTHPLADLTETHRPSNLEQHSAALSASFIMADYTRLASRHTEAPLVWRTWRSARCLLMGGLHQGRQGHDRRCSCLVAGRIVKQHSITGEPGLRERKIISYTTNHPNITTASFSIAHLY